jgi:hypothetical protein
MRSVFLLAALLFAVPLLAGKKDPEWRQGRVQNVSELRLPPTLAGPTPDSSNRPGAIAITQIRQTLAVEAADEVFLVEMVCLEGQEPRFPDDGSVTFAVTRKDFLVRDQGGRTRRYVITWRGPKSKTPVTKHQ